jgi:phage shock protein PspC (stress-responsive transcriptional regulator)
MPIKRLTRSSAEAKIGGVCAGLADYFEVDVVLVRTAWLVFSIVPGAIIGGVVAYLAAWLVMPERDAAAAVPDRGRRLTLSATDRKIAGVCGGIADYFNLDATLIRVLWVILSILFGAVVGGVIAYLAAWLIMPKAPASALVPTTVTPAA